MNRNKEGVRGSFLVFLVIGLLAVFSLAPHINWPKQKATATPKEQKAEMEQLLQPIEHVSNKHTPTNSIRETPTATPNVAQPANPEMVAEGLIIRERGARAQISRSSNGQTAVISEAEFLSQRTQKQTNSVTR